LEDRTLFSTNQGPGLTLLPAAVNPLVVNSLYQTVLQRPVDPTGLASWSAALGSGQSAPQAVLGILNSPEGRANQVQSLYGQFLHRQADPSGLNAFSAALGAGQTLEQVAAALVGSPEYYQARGGGTANGFLSALYQDALGRPVDASGQGHFAQALAQGATREQVAEAVFGSEEFRQDLVQSYYQHFLGREAEPGGLQYWTQALRQGRTSAGLIAGFAGSTERLGTDPLAAAGAAQHPSGSLAGAHSALKPAPIGGPGSGGPLSAGRLGNPMPYQAFDPSTVADTTNPTDQNFGPFVAGGTKTWNVVPGGGLSATPIPAGAQVLVLTVTVLNPTAGGGTLVVNPIVGPSYPTISVDPGITGPASYVIVTPVGPGGTVAVTSSFATDLAIDVDGFYLSNLDPGDQFPIIANINGQGAISGQNDSTAGSSSGIVGQISSTSPGGFSAGLRGINNGTGGNGIGVWGSQNGSGWGVYGTAAGAGRGVYGTAGTGGTGVYGAGTTGVFGTGATNGLGVDGSVTGSGNSSAGVRGSNSSTADHAYGVIGQITSTSPGSSSAGVRGINNDTGASGYGVWGSQNGGGIGVYGLVSGPGFGVYGTAGTNGRGVYGSAAAFGTGVYGDTGGAGFGVDGSVNGSGNGSAGVRGSNSSSANNAFGVIGQAGPGLFSAGVRGINYGTGVNGVGVWGSHPAGGYGVYGTAGTGGFGVVGSAPTAGGGLAGYFDGTVQVHGTLSKGGGSFLIDDPIDPLNKYLYHSFVESPDMMNIYNGIVTTDAEANATVTLPDYFMALNQDYRYQLTPIGQFAQTMVSSGVQNNHFSIRTDKPNVQVSWQVTGIRHDPFANANRIPNEAPKTGNEVGHYLYPEAYGLPREQGITYIQHPQLLNTGAGH
jgi:hypothetical protein